MSLVSYKNFFELLFESASHGKIHTNRKCLFCGSELDRERSKAIQTRVGRIRFLLHAIEEGINTADELLFEILTLGEYLGGRDIPEGDPPWWNTNAKEISSKMRKR